MDLNWLNWKKANCPFGFSSVHSQILYSAEDLFQGNYSELFLTVAQKSLA